MCHWDPLCTILSHRFAVNMEEVKKFLSEKGLSQYVNKFEKNGYDRLKTLKNLSPAEFEELSKAVDLLPGHKATLRYELGISGTLLIHDFETGSFP